MANLILCTSNIDVDGVLREHKKRYPDAAISVNFCYTEQQLASLLEHMQRDSSPEAGQRFAVKTQDGVRIVAVSDIVYCRCESHRYAVVLTGGEEILSRSFRRSFPQVLSPLLEGGGFLQCQASYIVNLRYVKSVGDKQLILHDGTHLPFPLSRQEKARTQLGFAPRV